MSLKILLDTMMYAYSSRFQSYLSIGRFAELSSRFDTSSVSLSVLVTSVTYWVPRTQPQKTPGRTRLV